MTPQKQAKKLKRTKALKLKENIRKNNLPKPKKKAKFSHNVKTIDHTKKIEGK